MNPRIAVRGVGGVQLIVADDPAKLAVCLDGGINRKGEISGHAKHPLLPET